jgi:hypothetical protein
VTEEDGDANRWSFCPGRDHGAAVMWLWGRQIEAYGEETMRRVRTTAAEGVRVVEDLFPHRAIPKQLSIIAEHDRLERTAR